jgi:hypothetical protein
MNKNILKAVFLISSLSLNICYANDIALVLGYQSFTVDELWHEKQIGFGVKNLVQQNLMDNTTFSLLDEKVVIGLKDKEIEEKLQDYWMLNDAKIAEGNLDKLAKENKLNHIFWVNIKSFSSTTSKMKIAFLNSSHYEDTLILDVCHYIVGTKITECKEGEATESRTLNGVLYEPTNKVNFKESGAGRLSQAAINQALSELFPHE